MMRNAMLSACVLDDDDDDAATPLRCISSLSCFSARIRPCLQKQHQSPIVIIIIVTIIMIADTSTSRRPEVAVHAGVPVATFGAAAKSGMPSPRRKRSLGPPSPPSYPWVRVGGSPDLLDEKWTEGVRL